MYWLLKSEPETFSWAQMCKDVVTKWDGVRNYQARNNMMAMKIGDSAFFYHSGAERAVVGIVEVVKEFYLDPKDETEKFGIVDVKFVRALKNPVLLSAIKSDSELQNIKLIKQSRLSVMPITKQEWDRIIALSE